MADLSLPARDSVAAQREMFRLAEKDHGLSLAVISQRTPIPPSTLKGWRDGAAMPAWAIGALGDAGVPDDLLSLVMEPWRRFIVTEPEGDGDLDTAASDASEFVGEVARARHPKSPGGLAIVPQERALIDPKRRRMCASARRAA